MVQLSFNFEKGVTSKVIAKELREQAELFDCERKSSCKDDEGRDDEVTDIVDFEEEETDSISAEDVTEIEEGFDFEDEEEEKQKTVSKKAVKKTTKKAPKKVYKLTEVNEACRQRALKTSVGEVKKLLKKFFKVETLSLIDKSEYGKVIQTMTKGKL